MSYGFKDLICRIPQQSVHIEKLVKEAKLPNEILENMKNGGLEYIPIFKEDRVSVLKDTLKNIDLSNVGGAIIAQSIYFKIDIDFNIPVTTISGQPCAITHLGIDLALQWHKEIKKDILLIGIDKSQSIDKRLYFNSAMGDVIIIGIVSNQNIKHKILSTYTHSYIFADNGEFSNIDDINKFRENNPLLIRENILTNLKNANLKLTDIKYIFPHTPYLQIWDLMSKVLNYPRERIWTKYISQTGHLNSNDSFYHYLKAIENKIIQKGDKVLLINNGFGGSRGSSILEYGGSNE